jgi:hypothetical protein
MLLTSSISSWKSSSGKNKNGKIMKSKRPTLEIVLRWKKKKMASEF